MDITVFTASFPAHPSHPHPAPKQQPSHTLPAAPSRATRFYTPNTPPAAVATATPISQPVVNIWSHGDIGSTVLTGNAGYANGITAYGSGADIWGNADAFHFTYQSLSGDGAIVAHVASLQNYATTTAISTSAKAGVMIRESLAAGARHGLVDVTPATLEFIRRSATNGSSASSSVAGTTAPYWLKLVRIKDTLTAYRSADGISWTSITSQTLGTLATNVYVGLAVCSHNTAAISRGVFDTISVATAVPAITSSKIDSAIVDTSFSFQVTATNAAYHFGATGLPNGLSINMSTGVISGAPLVSGTFPVAVTATNAFGTATDTLTIRVDMPPAIITRNIQVATGNDGTASITPQQVDSGSVSYSGALTLSLDRTSFSCTDIGSPVTVTLTGVDAKGHHGSATALVTVIDSIAPTVTAPHDQFFCYSSSGTYTIPALTATDNCGVASISYVVSGATSRSGSVADASGAYNVGVSTILWTVTDVHGNATTDTTTITVNPALNAAIPDVYAMSPAVDQKNTIYIGYGPTSLTITATPQGGTSPYRYLWNTGDTTASISVGMAGTYTVTVTDSKGCTTSAAITMNTLDVRCGNNNDKVMICHNHNTICVASGAVQAHLNHGDYLGSCNDAARQAMNAANGNASVITVYPNPVSDMLTIQLGALNTGAVMELYNASGVLVQTERLIKSTTALSVKILPAGLYYVRIKNGETTVTHKIVKL